MNKFLTLSLLSILTIGLGACSSEPAPVTETTDMTDTETVENGLYPSELSFLEGVNAIPADTEYVFTIDMEDYQEMFVDFNPVVASYVLDEVISIGEDTVTLKDNGEIPMGLVIPIPSSGGDALFVKGAGSFDAMVSIYEGVTLDFFASEVGMPEEVMYIPLTGEMKPGENVSADGDFATLGQCNNGQCWVWGFANSVDVYDESNIEVITPVDPSTLSAGDMIQGVVIGSFDEVEVVSVDGGVVTVQYEWVGEMTEDEITADQVML